MEKMPYLDGSEIKLRGPSGLILELVSNGQRQFQWAPEDKRALDVELRAFIVDYGPVPPGPDAPDPPVVRFGMTFGHGVQTWNHPIATPYGLAGTIGGAQITVPWVLPARGLVMRMSCRELFFSLQSPSKLVDPATGPWPYTKVQVSIQPVHSARLPAIARQQYGMTAPPAGSFYLETFPPEATEFRLFDNQGRPFAAGADLITFQDLGGGQLGAGVDVALYATFQPIPVNAIGWSAGTPDPTVGVSAEYR